MAVTVHPDGYYQIDAFENITDLSPGSIMWKMYRGIQQRLASFTRYEGFSFVSASNLEEAIIAPEAIIQSVGFWRQLQTWVMQLGNFGFLTPPAVLPTGEVQQPELITNVPSFTAKPSSDVTEDRLLQAEDIIGAWLVNDLLRHLSLLTWQSGQFSSGVSLTAKSAVGGGLANNSCAGEYQRRKNDFQNSLRTSSGQISVSLAARYEPSGSQYISDFGARYPSGPEVEHRTTVYSGISATWRKVLRVGTNTQGWPYSSLNGRAAGLWWIGDSEGESVAVQSSDLEYSYDGSAFPGDVFGVNCARPGRASFHAEILAYAALRFADLPT